MTGATREIALTFVIGRTRMIGATREIALTFVIGRTRVIGVFILVTPGFSLTSGFATRAFLVAVRLLINDFFWIAIIYSSRARF
jgi:hypothetical protein